ncbi:MAG: M50 family metallopeptidase [Actinomycetota bacterium]|nr:M50 family metallopeptidase [Actinomycetota bacterium]
MSVSNPAPETTSSLPEEAPAGDVPPRAGLMLLILIMGMGIYFGIVTDSFPVVIFVLGIILMVMIHEAGHFVVAKKCGMKVTQFFFGFGPRLWSFRRGETEYGVRALPFGGFVKIIGMSNVERDVDPADEPRTYRQQSFGKRVAVAVAGVTTHFILAFLVLTLIWFAIGIEDVDRPTLTVESITRDSAADKAGFQLGDRIVSIDGNPISEWANLPPYVQQRANQPVRFVVERDGRQVPLTATPGEITRDGKMVGFLGVGPGYDIERASLPEAVVNGAKTTGRITVLTVQSLGMLFAVGDYVDNLKASPDADRQGPAEDRPVSVVGAARLADQAAEEDIRSVLLLFAGLNIFVAVINLLPLLPFDGGHVAIATYERIRSRRGQRYHADVSKMMPVAVAVVAYFILVGAVTIFGDIVNPMQNPFQ